jgi:hypothetical protein
MTDREGDRDLYQRPDSGPLKANPAENARVRKLVVDELRAAAEADDHGVSTAAWGRARGNYARDWVALADKLGLHAPGEDQRTPLRDGETALGRRVSSAHTTLRQFLEGANQLEWALAGIEAVYCDRRGLALPGKAYQTQGRLDVGGAPEGT